MHTVLFALLALSVHVPVQAAPNPPPETPTGVTMDPFLPPSLVSFSDFKALVDEVEEHRAARLVDLNTFLRMSKEPNTIIFDARSDFRFERKHLAGAKHLSFSDFTVENLQKIIPDQNTRILIYCNNNFDGDPVDFATKMAPRFDAPPRARESQILGNQKPVMLALNIPTYINLFGYGYRNVYELGELVSISDKRIRFEGSVVAPVSPR